MTAVHDVPRDMAHRLNPLIDAGTMETLQRVAFMLDRLAAVTDICDLEADGPMGSLNGVLRPAAAALWFEADQLERIKLGKA